MDTPPHVSTDRTTYKRFNRAPVEKTVVVFLAHLTVEVPLTFTEHPDGGWVARTPDLHTGNPTIDGALAALR